MSSPKTRSGPRARTQSAAVTELSMPPDMPTTAPRRRRVPMTCSRIDSATRVDSFASSIRSTSRENATLTPREELRGSVTIPYPVGRATPAFTRPPIRGAAR